MKKGKITVAMAKLKYCPFSKENCKANNCMFWKYDLEVKQVKGKSCFQQSLSSVYGHCNIKKQY